MTVRPEVLALAQDWIEKAENDLRNAEHTLTLREDCPYDTVCFHAQQCVEKYLKAMLVLQGAQFPRTHDLTELCELLAEPAPSAIPIERLAELTPYAVEARYPGEWEDPTREEATTAVENALEIRRTLRHLLPPGVL